MEINAIIASSDLRRTEHFQRRQAQRSITDVEVGLALRHGRCFFEGEDRVYFLGKKQMPSALDARVAGRLDGLTVVVNVDGALITVWRNPNGLRKIRKRHH
jgi:hypothetical protein